MVRRITTALAVAGGLLVAAAAWGRLQRARVETVPYRVLDRLGPVELRRYPATVRVETTADTDRAAFGRLFRYISGANETREDVSMTAPVEVTDHAATVPMTAPVEVTRTDEAGRRMAFFLPSEYDVESAPTPTDPDVDLVAVPERTLAVHEFSWRPTDRRIASKTTALLATLAEARIDPVGDPFYMGYDAPWTVPFLRRNEVAVEVDASDR